MLKKKCKPQTGRTCLPHVLLTKEEYLEIIKNLYESLREKQVTNRKSEMKDLTRRSEKSKFKWPNVSKVLILISQEKMKSQTTMRYHITAKV